MALHLLFIIVTPPILKVTDYHAWKSSPTESNELFAMSEKTHTPDADSLQRCSVS
jgi:hypothetical protein